LLLDVPLFASTCLSIIVFYLTTHKVLYGNLRDAVKRLPLMMALSIGLSVNNARAVLEGLFGVQSEFVRTPKHGIEKRSESWAKMKYKAAMGSVGTYIELAFGVYFVITIAMAVMTGAWVSIPFLVLFMVGFLYVGTLSLFQLR
jgi:hypothetical protein